MKNEYALAVAGKKAIELKDATEALKVIIGRIYIHAGQYLSDEDLPIVANLLNTDILRDFRYLTIQEVQLAMENGVREQYGAYYGLNLVTFNRWLTKYMESSKRIEAIKANIPVRNNLKIAAEYDLKEKSLIYFTKYQKEKSIGMFCSNVYDYLQSNGYVNQSKKLKNKAMKEAEESYVKEMKMLVADVDIGISLTKQRIVVRAKRICLYSFFDELIEMKVELKDIINANTTN